MINSVSSSHASQTEASQKSQPDLPKAPTQSNLPQDTVRLSSAAKTTSDVEQGSGSK